MGETNSSVIEIKKDRFLNLTKVSLANGPLDHGKLQESTDDDEHRKESVLAEALFSRIFFQ